MNNTTRFTKLLGECRRQMNGAVVGSMRYYGAEYRLNYGVSLPTIRALAQKEGRDHSYAKYLYLQQVREIQLASLHIAMPEEINHDELNFWAGGIINSEIAEEAAFALFQHVENVQKWIESEEELLVYTALLSIAKSKSVAINDLSSLVATVIKIDSMLTTTALITLLESYYRVDENQPTIDLILAELPQTKHSAQIIEEMEWRCDCYR